MLEYNVKTNKRCELIEVDKYLQDAVSTSGIINGVVVAFVPHTTAGILINENADPAVKQDILSSLERKIPFDDGYQHLEGNSAAHIKTSLVGNSVFVMVSNGRLKLGTWQSVFFAEFDGPRHRQLWISPLKH